MSYTQLDPKLTIKPTLEEPAQVFTDPSHVGLVHCLPDTPYLRCDAIQVQTPCVTPNTAEGSTTICLRLASLEVWSQADANQEPVGTYISGAFKRHHPSLNVATIAPGSLRDYATAAVTLTREARSNLRRILDEQDILDELNEPADV